MSDLPGGIVLAGGRSGRFGRDKLAEPVDGTPLLWHPIRALAAAGFPEIVVVLSPVAPEPSLPGDLPATIRFVRDPEPFGGPLVGLRAGLAAATTRLVVVVAGDQPTLEPALLRLLAAGLDEPGPSAVVPVDPDGRPRPLPCALDRVAALEAAEAILGRGDRRLRDLLAELPVRALPEAAWRAVDPGAGWTRDVDEPGDLSRG